MRLDVDMDVVNNSPFLEIAGTVADCIAQRGYAFVEDDMIAALAENLELFLTSAGIMERREIGLVDSGDDIQDLAAVALASTMISGLNAEG